MTNGAEGKLARVTYLPGVTPPSAPSSVPSFAAQVAPSHTIEDAGDVHVPLETIPGLIRASEISTRPADLAGKRFLGTTGEVEPVEAAAPAPAEERSSRAHNVSMNALARRGVSSSEMADLLARRELAEHDIEIEIARLQGVGLLDDRQLAETLVRTLRERKGLGRAAITAELRRRRIDPSLVGEAIDEAYETGTDDLTRARELAIKRAPQLRSLDPETARRRLGAFLMRKGYSGSVVASAVAAALAPNHPTQRSSTLPGRAPGGPRFE